mmetsp:Transcript_23813/g.66903  ORF Transcript_23813/g.66903 Transcript_23813/m.66903 type:complete len:406 (-) Transcript_23813:278-1495(-)
MSIRSAASACSASDVELLSNGPRAGEPGGKQAESRLLSREVSAFLAGSLLVLLVVGGLSMVFAVLGGEQPSRCCGDEVAPCLACAAELSEEDFCAGIENNLTRSGLCERRVDMELFAPVDGGADRACRGVGTDDSAIGKVVLPGASLIKCKAQCLRSSGCRGIEYGEGRCGVWMVELKSSSAQRGYSCLRYSPHEAERRKDQARADQHLALPSAVGFQPVNGGANQACRARGSADGHNEHIVYAAPMLDDCKQRCTRASTCTGIEFGNGQCKVWTVAITGSSQANGLTCLTHTPEREHHDAPEGEGDAESRLDVSMKEFEPVDGGADRACRGADTDDDADTNKVVWPSPSLRHCQKKCLRWTYCTGIEFGMGRCEVWKVAILVTVPKQGYHCFRHKPSLNPSLQN